MSSEDRREQILAAATQVFGERGYVGGTTDAIARAAGISQAYVVRTFGSKESLFFAAGQRAADHVEAVFREVIEGFTGDESADERERRLGEAYGALVADRGVLLTLMHLFTLGHDTVFGPLARESFLRIYEIVRDDAHMSPEAASLFFARGMLINTLMGLRMPEVESDQPYAHELMFFGLGDKCHEIMESGTYALADAEAGRV